MIDLLQGLLHVQKRPRKHHLIKTGIFFYGVAKRSAWKFCPEFFTQIPKHFRAYFRFHWADHSDLGMERWVILVLAGDLIET